MQPLRVGRRTLTLDPGKCPESWYEAIEDLAQTEGNFKLPNGPRFIACVYPDGNPPRMS